MNSILSTLRKRLILRAIILGMILPGIAIFPCLTYANPAGGVVVSGNVNFAGLGTASLAVNQASNLAIIDWQSFSIGAGEITTFNQPGVNSLALNRVVTGNPSAIYGQLRSNGGVIVINPNGIVVGPNGVVDTGGFLGLSTLDISNKDFLNGGKNRYRGVTSAGVANYGALSSQNGDVVLLGNFLKNAGSVNAGSGTVAFGSGGDIIVDQAGGATISILSGGVGGAVGIENTGTINGAAAELKSHGNVYALAIKNDGLVRANGYKFKGGRLTLSAGTSGRVVNTGDLYARNSDGSGGSVRVTGNKVDVASGRVDASGATGKNGGQVLIAGEEVSIGAAAEVSVAGDVAGSVNLSGVNSLVMDGKVDATSSVGNGGDIVLQGHEVTVGSTASVDVSGVAGGGQIRNGGGFQGKDGRLMNSNSTTVARGATFKADSSEGDGGGVFIWSDGNTIFKGAISAQAKGAVGNGGFIEISGKKKLFYDGSANTLAAGNGKNGTLLFDPTDVFIGPTGATMTDEAVVAAVLLNNVVIHTSSTDAQNGNIWIEFGSDIEYDSPNSLSFFANGSIFVDGDIKNHGSTDGLVNAVGTKVIGAKNSATPITVNIGTGNINLVAGWDGTGAGTFSGEFDPATGDFTAPFSARIFAADIIGGTFGDYGLNNGSVIINLSAREPVEVGSAKGETNVFGDVVVVKSGNGGMEFAQIGYRRENDIRGVAVSSLGADGLFGGTGADADTLIKTYSINSANRAETLDPATAADKGDIDYFTGVTGDINVYAKGEVTLRNYEVGNVLYADRVTDRAYTMIGHGGRREQDNDAELRGGTDYGSDSGNITLGNGNNHGDITIMAGGKVSLAANRAESHSQIGHGGGGHDDPDGNPLNTASNEGPTWLNQHFPNAYIFGDMSGDITVTGASLDMKGGFMNATFVMIGHGGERVRGNHTGNITIETTIGGILVEAAPDAAIGGPANDANSWIHEQNRDQSFAQIGHGGFDSDHIAATAARTVTVNNNTGHVAVANTSNPGDGIAINPVTGRSYGHEGDISVISNGGIEFRAGNGTDAYAMLGHGGRSTNGDHRGNIKAEAKAGSIIFTRDANQVNRFGRDLTDLGQRAHVQIGHGGGRYHGGSTGDIDVDATGDIEFYGGRSESFAMIGHGGRGDDGSTWNGGRQRGREQANGTHSGDIDVNAGGNIKFRSGFSLATYSFSQIGHGGYFQVADVLESTAVGSLVEDIAFQPVGTLLGGGASAADQEGHNGDIVVTAGGDISFIAGATDLLEGQTYLEMNGRENYTMIGNGGRSSWGDHWGAITITAGGDLNLEARAGWDAVTIEGTNDLFTEEPRLNSTEDNGRTGYRNWAQIGNGGYDSDHRNTNNTQNWNNSGKNSDGFGTAGNSDIIINIGGNLTALGAMKNTAGIPIPIRAILTNGVPNPIIPRGADNEYEDEAGNTVLIGATYSGVYGRLKTIVRSDGEVWTLPEPVLSAEDGFVQIGNGGRSSEYHGSGGALTAGGTATSVNPIDGLGHRGNVTINAGGDIRIEAGDIKQAVSIGQTVTINVTNYQGNPGGVGTLLGTGTYFVGPGLGTDVANFIGGDNSQNDPSQGIRNYAHVGLGGWGARGDHNGTVSITGGGNLDLIAGEGRESYAQIGPGGWDSDRQNSDNLRNGDIGQIGDINIAIDGKLTMKGGGLQNGDTTGLLGNITSTSLTATNEARGAYVQIGAGGALTGGNHVSNIDVVAGTGVEIEAGNNQRGAYGMIGSGGYWARSESKDGNIRVVALTGDIDLKGAIPVEDTLDDGTAPDNGPGLGAGNANVHAPRESFVMIGNGGHDSDAQGGNQNNTVGTGGNSGDIEVIAAAGSISLQGGGSATIDLNTDNFRDLNVQIGHGGSFTDGDLSGDIRISASVDLSITGGLASREAYAQIGHGGLNAAGNYSGTIDVEVGNDLNMTRGSGLRNSWSKIGHGVHAIGRGNNGSGDRSGDITVSVGENATFVDGVDGTGGTARGPLIGHFDPRNGGFTNVGTSTGQTFIAVSRNNPDPTGTGTITTSPQTVFASADGGFLTQLRIYMPTAAQDGIVDGTYLNSAAYTRTPVPGTRTNADEHLATEHTLGVGPLGSPTGDFTPEGPYPGNGFGFYNLYFANATVIPPTTPVGPTVFDFFPFLFDKMFDSFERGGFLFEYDGYEEGQLDSMALDDSLEGAGDSGGSFFEQVLDASVGPRKKPYEEGEANEDLDRIKSKQSGKVGRSGLSFYVFDPGTNKYSSYRVFGTPRTDTAVSQ